MSSTITFKVIPRKTDIEQHSDHTVVLQEDRWNDFGYQTLFQMYVFSNGNLITIGDVKICHINQEYYVPIGARSKYTVFSYLEEDYCSLGQSTEYYQNLQYLDPDIALNVLTKLNDCAINNKIYERFKNLDVFQTSLLRFSSAAEALDKARSILFDEAQTVIRNFVLDYRGTSSRFNDYIEFDFEKTTVLPSQINLLVGENGVGKTRMMSDLAFLLTKYADDNSNDSTGIPTEASLNQRPSFYRLIAISFNAFDHFAIPKGSDNQNFEYYYRGLRSRPNEDQSNAEGPIKTARHSELKTQQQLLNEISDSMDNISANDERTELYKRYCQRIFPPWLYADDEEFFDIKIYNELSAGQRICLNIVSGLVELIDDESLILFDEPENHLHPMMMSTIMNIFFDLLERYSACAVIASHSPIVAQQVPRRYVKVIHRDDYVSRIILRPEIETFGASISDLTTQVFEALEHERDYRHLFHEMLKDCGGDIESVEDAFDGELTPSAKMVLRQISKS